MSHRRQPMAKKIVCSCITLSTSLPLPQSCSHTDKAARRARVYAPALVVSSVLTVLSPLHTARCPLPLSSRLGVRAEGQKGEAPRSLPRRALSVAAPRASPAAVVFPAPRRTPRASRSRLDPS